MAKEEKKRQGKLEPDKDIQITKGVFWQELCRGRLYGQVALGGRQFGEPYVWLYCPTHGDIPSEDWLWKMVEDIPQPYCSECGKKLVPTTFCPDHRDISFDKIIWKDNEPYCPQCHKKLC
jgi:hypothetical protein